MYFMCFWMNFNYAVFLHGNAGALASYCYHWATTRTANQWRFWFYLESHKVWTLQEIKFLVLRSKIGLSKCWYWIRYQKNRRFTNFRQFFRVGLFFFVSIWVYWGHCFWSYVKWRRGCFISGCLQRIWFCVRQASRGFGF